MHPGLFDICSHWTVRPSFTVFSFGADVNPLLPLSDRLTAKRQIVQVTFEMARAETIESAGETGIGRNGLFSQHSTCCLELARPLQTGPGRLSTAPITYSSGTDTSPMHRHHNGHSLQSLQAVCVSNPFMYLHPEDQDQPSSYQQLPSSSSAPFPLPLHYRGGNDEGFAGEQSGWDQETHQEPCNRQGPLPDLLPQTELLSRLSSTHRGTNERQLQLRVRRMAVQLRTIGDEFNATLLHRANVPYWQVWSEACSVLLHFISQTLSTLYRLT